MREAKTEWPSRVYFDLFVRSADLITQSVSAVRYMSLRAHELSFNTYTPIRSLWNLMVLRVPNWKGFEVSFTTGPEPSAQDIEEIQIGMTLWGLTQIAALGRALADHAQAMLNMRITRILINTAPDDEGLEHGSFQILLILMPKTYS
ncbi:hypothetical protein TWF694_006349 [Orbilia ellipsospora]|uniref:Uncharacterized protein n=1 Tax=Orbilia ellipsospora TaxID=2528407 RepID=A0AAV9XJT2_9PEZI